MLTATFKLSAADLFSICSVNPKLVESIELTNTTFLGSRYPRTEVTGEAYFIMRLIGLVAENNDSLLSVQKTN